jgi:hypothetical protein
MNMEPFDESLLTAYLDGELSPIEIEYVEQAMAASPRLRQSYEELKCLRRWIVSAVNHASPIRPVERQLTVEPKPTADALTETDCDPATITAASQWPWMLDQAALDANPSSAQQVQSQRLDSAAHSDRQSNRHSARSRMGWTAFAALAATLLIVLLSGGLPLAPLWNSLSYSVPKRDDANSQPSQEREQPTVDSIVQSAPIDRALEDFSLLEATQLAPLPKALDQTLAQPEIASAKGDPQQVDVTLSYAWAIQKNGETENLKRSPSHSGDAPHAPTRLGEELQPLDANLSDVPQVASSDAANRDREEIRLLNSAPPNDDTEVLQQLELSQPEPVQRTGDANRYSDQAHAFDKTSDSDALRKYDPRLLTLDDPRRPAHHPIEIHEPSNTFVDWLGDQLERAAHAPPPIARLPIPADSESASDSDAPIQLHRDLARDGRREENELREQAQDAEPKQPLTPAVDADEKAADSTLKAQVARGLSKKQVESSNTNGYNSKTVEDTPATNADNGVSWEREIRDPGNHPSDSKLAMRAVPRSADSHRLRFRFRSTEDRQFTSNSVAMPWEMQWESPPERTSHFSLGFPSEWTTSWRFGEPTRNAPVALPTPAPPEAQRNIEPKISSDSPSPGPAAPPTNGRSGSAEPSSRREDVGPMRIYALEFAFTQEQTTAALTSLKGFGIQWEAPGNWPSRPVVLQSQLSESASDRLATVLHAVTDLNSSQENWTPLNAPPTDVGTQLPPSDPQLEKRAESESTTSLRSVWLILVLNPTVAPTQP